MNIKKIVSGAVMFLFTASSIQACSFISASYDQIYMLNDVVFMGKIIKQDEIENGVFKFEVIENFKGYKIDLGKLAIVTDPLFGTSCQKIGYKEGKFWIISTNGSMEISEKNMDKSFDTQKEAVDFYNKQTSKSDYMGDDDNEEEF